MKKYTLITGASSGLGEVYAEQYAQKKQNLIFKNKIKVAQT